jgi:hypothetical protein
VELCWEVRELELLQGLEGLLPALGVVAPVGHSFIVIICCRKG